MKKAKDNNTPKASAQRSEAEPLSLIHQLEVNQLENSHDIIYTLTTENTF